MQYRFFITYGATPVRLGVPPTATTVEVFPAGGMALRHEKPNDFCAGFRRNWNGKLTLKDKDYQLLKGLEITDKYAPVTLIVKKRKANIWSEFWRGLFSPYNCEWDNDRCTCSFTPTVFDEYTLLIDNFDREKNFFDCSVGDQFKVGSIGSIEEATITYNGVTNPAIYVGLYGVSFGTNYPSGEQWLLTEQTYTANGSTWDLSEKIKRLIKITADVNGVATPPTSGTWYEEDAVIYAGIPCHKYVLAAAEFKALFETAAIHDNTQTSYRSYLELKGSVHSRGRWVYDLLQFYLDDYFLTLKSDFFQSDVNPVTGETNNPIKYMQLVEKSDFKSPTSSEPASLELLKFSDLISDLCSMFNLLWCIDGDKFIIENYSYFNDLNTLDLTQIDSGKWVKNLNKYSYISSEKPRKETWTFNETTDDLDFVGVPIEYQITGKSDSTENYQIGNIFTDINSIIVSPSRYGNNGFVLVSLVWSVNKWIVNESVGKLTNYSKLNGYLSISTLIDNFWKTGRPLPTGIMNGVSTSFVSIKQKQQVSVSFPLDENTYTPYSNIKTGLGWGRISELELDLKTNTYKTTLEYD